MDDDAEWDSSKYFRGRRPDRLIVGSRFPERMRIASEIVTGDDRRFATVEDEVVLRIRNNGKFEIKTTFHEDDRGIRALTIQRWNVDTGRPHEHAYFTFVGDEIPRLLQFVQRVRTIHLDGPGAVKVDIDELVQVTPEQAKRLVSENPKLVIEAATHDITQQDIVALAYRKEQLAIFERLLMNGEYFDKERVRAGGREAVWQAFFTRNPWIFGYGLSYVLMSELDDRKLEQVVRGADLTGAGKRADGLMKTNAYMNALCFIEVKRHDTPLLKKADYRPGTWAASEELAGGVAQCHETVRASLERIHGRLRPESHDGTPTGEDLFAVDPRSFLVIGSLDEFHTSMGPNAAKFRSFEMFRRNLHRPEVITYDELLYRARFIVEHQAGGKIDQPLSIDDDDEIPFLANRSPP